MSKYTEEKRAYKIEACAEAMAKVLKANKKKGEYLPMFKSKLIELTAARVADDWRKDKYSHVINGKTISCPDIKFIKYQDNWSDIRNACNELLKVGYATYSFYGYVIGGEVELTRNLKHLESLSNGAVKQHNLQAELSNKRGATHQFLQVRQLALPNR